MFHIHSPLYLFLKDFGQYYNFKRDFKNATTYFNKALAIAKKLGNNSYIATITGKLAYCEYDKGNLDQALAGFKEELSIFPDSKYRNALVGDFCVDV